MPWPLTLPKSPCAAGPASSLMVKHTYIKTLKCFQQQAETHVIMVENKLHNCVGVILIKNIFKKWYIVLIRVLQIQDTNVTLFAVNFGGQNLGTPCTFMPSAVVRWAEPSAPASPGHSLSPITLPCWVYVPASAVACPGHITAGLFHRVPEHCPQSGAELGCRWRPCTRLPSSPFGLHQDILSHAVLSRYHYEWIAMLLLLESSVSELPWTRIWLMTSRRICWMSECTNHCRSGKRSNPFGWRGTWQCKLCGSISWVVRTQSCLVAAVCDLYAE